MPSPPRTLLTLAVTAQLSVFAAPLSGQEPILVPTTPSAGFESLEKVWADYVTAERDGDAQAMERLLGRIQLLRVERNIREVRDLALAVTYRAEIHLAQGELREAEIWFMRAVALDPDLPLPRFGLAQVARRRGGAGWLRYLTESAVGHVLGAGSTFSFSNGAFLGMGAFFLLALLFSLLMIYRYAVLLSHDFAERLEDRFGAWMVTGLTVATLLLPVVVALGPAWLPFYWLAVTFAYQSLREKILTGVALLGLALVAPLAEVEALSSRTWLNPIYRAATAVLEGTTIPSDVHVLEASVKAYPEDRDLELLLAGQFKKLGDYERSAALYRQILERKPDDLVARINLGNIYYAQHDYDGAKLEYRKANAAHPRSALALYNLSQVHAVNFEFKDRDVARAGAEQLDRERVRYWSELEYPVLSGSGVGDAGTGVVDVGYSWGELQGKFLGLSEGRHDRPRPKWSGALFTGRTKRFWIAAIGLALTLGLAQLVLPFRSLTQRCWRCASPFCARCQIGTGRRGLCTQCHHLFVTKDGISAAARNEKVAQVQQVNRKRRLVFRALSLLAPGAGHVAEDRTLSGILFLSLWISGWLSLATRERLYPRADQLMNLEGGAAQVVIAVLLAGTLVAANLVAQPRLRA